MSALLVPLLACSVVACDNGASGSEADAESWVYPQEGNEDALADGPNPTTDRGVEVFRGYNVVTDSALGVECVEPQSRRFRAGATTSSGTTPPRFFGHARAMAW